MIIRLLLIVVLSIETLIRIKTTTYLRLIFNFRLHIFLIQLSELRVSFNWNRKPIINSIRILIFIIYLNTKNTLLLNFEIFRSFR